MGVSATGAIGLGISPVSGDRRVPFPAARAIAFISGHLHLPRVTPVWCTYRDSFHRLFAVAEPSVLSPLHVPACPHELAFLKPVYLTLLIIIIHPIAWKGYSRKFALTGVSDPRTDMLQLYPISRESLTHLRR